MSDKKKSIITTEKTIKKKNNNKTQKTNELESKKHKKKMHADEEILSDEEEEDEEEPESVFDTVEWKKSHMNKLIPNAKELLIEHGQDPSKFFGGVDYCRNNQQNIFFSAFDKGMKQHFPVPVNKNNQKKKATIKEKKPKKSQRKSRIEIEECDDND